MPLITDKVYQALQAIPDKRTARAIITAIERLWPRTRAVNVTAALTLNQDVHDGKVLTVNSAAGIALTLPASTGQGARYRLYIGTTITSIGTTIKVANASDFMFGNVYQAGATGASTAFSTANTGTAGTESDTITMNGTTTGGFKGDYLDIEDVALNAWRVLLHTRISGTAATPFSATV
jgi:hypothetical protein